MTDESYPSELKYYKEHDWVRVEDDDAVFGISWFAQDALGEIVYVSLPEVGDLVGTRGEVRRAQVRRKPSRTSTPPSAARWSPSTTGSPTSPGSSTKIPTARVGSRGCG